MGRAAAGLDRSGWQYSFTSVSVCTWRIDERFDDKGAVASLSVFLDERAVLCNFAGKGRLSKGVFYFNAFGSVAVEGNLRKSVG